MFVTGVICNIVIAVVIGRVPIVYIVVMGTALTGTASLLFALISPSSPYWSFGFPASIVGVFGADFVFASGTLFVAKVALPHEQSVGGALFQTMTQIGTAFGLTITTIVFDKVVKRDTPAGATTPADSRAALLEGYKSAQWTAFAFAMFSSLLAALFLRGVGIVGHNKADEAELKEAEVEEEGKVLGEV